MNATVFAALQPTGAHPLRLRRLEYRTEAIGAGCAGFIEKLVDLERLLETVKLFALASRTVG